MLVALRHWGIKNFPDGAPWGSEVVDRSTGQAITSLEFKADDGSSVSPDAIELRPAS